MDTSDHVVSATFKKAPASFPVTWSLDGTLLFRKNKRVLDLADVVEGSDGVGSQGLQTTMTVRLKTAEGEKATILFGGFSSNSDEAEQFRMFTGELFLRLATVAPGAEIHTEGGRRKLISMRVWTFLLAFVLGPLLIFLSLTEDTIPIIRLLLGAAATTSGLFGLWGLSRLDQSKLLISAKEYAEAIAAAEQVEPDDAPHLY